MLHNSSLSISKLIREMSVEDMARLKRFAGYKMFALSGRVNDADERDLLNEAIVRALDNRRSYDPDRETFVMFLMGCMNSIASQWASQLKGRGYESRSIHSEIADGTSTLEFRLVCAEILARVRLCVQGHEIALLVYEEMLEGFTSEKIKEHLHIEDLKYKAARKQISRCVNKIQQEVKNEDKRSKRSDDETQSAIVSLPEHFNVQ